MPAPPYISAAMTARQVVKAWPACGPVLESCRGAKVDGRWTLQEIGYLARDDGSDEMNLLSTLSRVADVPIAPDGRQGQGGSPLPLIFTAIAVCLTLGGGWGVILLLRIATDGSFTVASAPSIHVHGTAQLWGWMAMFIIGVASHLLRQGAKHPAPVWLQYLAGGAIAAAIPIFFAGSIEPLRRMFPPIDVVASALLAIAAAGFGLSVMLSLRRVKIQQWHRFVRVMVAWLWIWSIADLTIRILSAHRLVPTDLERDLLIVLPVLGFAVNAIYGFGIRIVPGLLTINHPRTACFTVTIIAHNAGLAVFLIPFAAAHVAGAALMLAAAVSYVIGMRGLRGKTARPIYGVDVRGHIMIRIAFFWLIAGLTMILMEPLLPAMPHAYEGAWRHALTVGFITTMILGVAHRLAPVFIKQPLASTRMMLAAAALIIVGNAGRVTLELLTIGQWTWAYHWMGATGLLELAAIALFGLNLLWTARNRRHVYRPEEPITPDVRVREVVNVRPAMQSWLRNVGVDMFDKTLFIAPSLTFGALALGEGQTPWGFLKQLDEQSRSPLVRTPIALNS